MPEKNSRTNTEIDANCAEDLEDIWENLKYAVFASENWLQKEKYLA